MSITVGGSPSLVVSVHACATERVRSLTIRSLQNDVGASPVHRLDCASQLSHQPRLDPLLDESVPDFDYDVAGVVSSAVCVGYKRLVVASVGHLHL